MSGIILSQPKSTRKSTTLNTMGKDSILLFSYGSNMSIKELMKYNNKLHNDKLHNKSNNKTDNQSVNFNVLDIGYLPNHKFYYLPLYTNCSNRTLKTAKATIIKNNNKSRVYGTITEVTPELYKLILKKEGVNKKYYKPVIKTVISRVTKKKYKVVTFVMTEKYETIAIKNSITRKLSDKIIPSILPSNKYRTLIVKAAKFYNFPKKYIDTYLNKTLTKQ
jgi:hypothetical protein